jgi:AcrR family transcriptional regulator
MTQSQLRMPQLTTANSRKRQRAIDADEKASRRHALLDAAERLLTQQPERLPNVVEVAAEAGLAKGTVYLYFPSKEELLLALHERQVSAVFSALFSLLDEERTVTVDAMLALIERYIVQPPVYLPLTALCLGMMEKSIPPDARLKFHQRLAEWLNRAGSGLERHFPALKPGEGTALLMYSHALIVGLWQMMQPDCLPAQFRQQPDLEVFDRNYKVEVERAVRALWNGLISSPPT